MLELTRENYHSTEANAEYMSVHQFRAWQECAAREKAHQSGLYTPPDKEVFLVGSYVDIALTGTAYEFAAFQERNHDTIYKANGGMYKPFEVAEAMVKRLRRDGLAMELLSGGHQQIITGTFAGCQWRGQVDVLKENADIFVDLKTAASFEEVWTSYIDPLTQIIRNEKVPWYDRYWFQLAVYGELLRQRYERPFVPLIVAVTKQDPPDIGAWMFDFPDRLALELAAAEAAIGQILAYKRGDAPAPACGSCDYCRATKTLKVVDATDYRGRGRQ